MDGRFQNNTVLSFVSRAPFSTTARDLLVAFDNPVGDITINRLDISALLYQPHFFTPIIPPLTHVCAYV